jgi:hypothetical protein
MGGHVAQETSRVVTFPRPNRFLVGRPAVAVQVPPNCLDPDVYASQACAAGQTGDPISPGVNRHGVSMLDEHAHATS